MVHIQWNRLPTLKLVLVPRLLTDMALRHVIIILILEVSVLPKHGRAKRIILGLVINVDLIIRRGSSIDFGTCIRGSIMRFMDISDTCL